MLKKRDFKIKGTLYHLNDNHAHNEFEGKYVLLFWHEGYERWQSLGTVNSKIEALIVARAYAM